jgi:hypothetical protein
MSRAGRPTRRKRRAVAIVRPTTTFSHTLRSRLLQPDPRSHAEFLTDMRAEQAAGQLANPATAALIDRLSNALSRDNL